MIEAQKMVHLTPAQRCRKRFSHPLTGNAPRPMSKERLNQLLAVYFEADEGSELHIEIGRQLMVNYLRLLGGTVARYLYHWPITRRFLNEVISSGAEAITKVIVKLRPEQLKGASKFKILGHLIENAIRQSIETIVNDFRGVAPASERTNRTRESRRQRPIYGIVKTDLGEAVQNSQEYNDIDLFVFEIEDAIEKIAKTELERQILARENWSLSHAELGEKLNKGERWVLEVRSRLYERYMKLGGV